MSAGVEMQALNRLACMFLWGLSIVMNIASDKQDGLHGASGYERWVPWWAATSGLFYLIAPIEVGWLLMGIGVALVVGIVSSIRRLEWWPQGLSMGILGGMVPLMAGIVHSNDLSLSVLVIRIEEAALILWCVLVLTMKISRSVGQIRQQ